MEWAQNLPSRVTVAYFKVYYANLQIDLLMKYHIGEQNVL